MKNFIIPQNYNPVLDIRQTEIAIKTIKDFFQQALANTLNLQRVSAPLFVSKDSGLNDNLNGVERPVSFDIKEQPYKEYEIVHSLAKWKRMALKRYNFSLNEGLYTDMNAIRRDEDTDNIHSVYVDQWDWESIIKKQDRNIDTLKDFVCKIYRALLKTEKVVAQTYPYIKPILPDNITFITAQELLDLYPDLDAKQREYKITKKYGAVFIIGIGSKLSCGSPHDNRAPDYDDWSLNGDILLYYPLLDIAFEISSMGIRVDSETLLKQLKETNNEDRLNLDFQSKLYNNQLPYTIGGGIGQSRLCMFFLRKAHIGEVQASVWSDDDVAECKKANISLL
ncbi:MAG: aspartate--ammonia ligase [Clostridia bacterium]|nr:aspartate--ammonia ligase [Clostridia bacterium]